MRGHCAVAVTLVVAAAAGGCAPAPRIEPSDAATNETLPFVPFSPGAADAGADGAVDESPSVVDVPASANLVSDFEQSGPAVVVETGAPPRHGSWYAYNDASPTCSQVPAPGDGYVAATPPVPSPGGGQALHALWFGCTGWGAGVAAHLNGAGDPVVPYDLTGYTGVTFYAMAAPGGGGVLRVMFPMTDDTLTTYGGACDEQIVGPGKCSDAHQQVVSLPTDGTWHKLTVSFADPSRFGQEGWGARFGWNPAHVTSIQIQSVAMGGPYDFWLDDVYLTR